MLRAHWALATYERVLWTRNEGRSRFNWTGKTCRPGATSLTGYEKKRQTALGLCLQGLLSSPLCWDGLHTAATNNRKSNLLRTVSCELFVTARRELTRYLHFESHEKQESFPANLDFTWKIIKQEVQENGSLKTIIMQKETLKEAQILNKLSHVHTPRETTPGYVAKDTMCKWQQTSDLGII